MSSNRLFSNILMIAVSRKIPWRHDKKQTSFKINTCTQRISCGLKLSQQNIALNKNWQSQCIVPLIRSNRRACFLVPNLQFIFTSRAVTHHNINDVVTRTSSRNTPSLYDVTHVPFKQLSKQCKSSFCLSIFFGHWLKTPLLTMSFQFQHNPIIASRHAF